MKHIVKNDEPNTFAEWKILGNENRQPTWENLAGTPKRELHASLVQEQGWICCYCCCRIENTESHIEHLRPRSRFQEEALNYRNMLASCGREDRFKEPKHCGKRKGEWYDPDLMISPLEPNCETRFRFAADGSIYPTKECDAGALETITRLGLDISKLARLREAAIDSMLQDTQELTEDNLRKIIESLFARDINGRFAEFCIPVTQVLTGLLSS